MNDIALSNNLDQIELEIQHHKNIAGQSIWEIGRRLIHVKDKKLAHGEFRDWHESIGIDKDFASKAMRVSKELPNVETLRHLGVTALNLIATLPEEEREAEHETSAGEIKKPDEMTVREIQDLKRELKERERQIKEQEKTIQQKQELIVEGNRVITNYATQKPEVVEKIIEVQKEVMHPHIDDLRSDNAQLSKALRKAQEEADDANKRNEFVEGQLNKLLEQRADVDKKSKEYDQLTEAINNAQGKLNNTQKMVSDHNDILKIIRQGSEAILKIGGLAFMDIAETVNGSVVISREFDSMIRSLERLTRDLTNVRKQNIIEGDFIND